jgi:hypothetical protein
MAMLARPVVHQKSTNRQISAIAFLAESEIGVFIQYALLMSQDQSRAPPTDAQTDLIGDGFDAALRIAVMEDSSLVACRIAPVRRFLVASRGDGHAAAVDPTDVRSGGHRQSASASKRAGASLDLQIAFRNRGISLQRRR